ncbi:hypothetical protein ABK040_004077 [Willaertia magna]
MQSSSTLGKRSNREYPSSRFNNNGDNRDSGSDRQFNDNKKKQKMFTDNCESSKSIIFSMGEQSPQRGIPTTVTSSPLDPKYIQPNFKIKKITMGYTHTIMLTTDGRVLSCGQNSNCQCGHPSNLHSSIDSPTLIESLDEEIISVRCGYYFTVLLTRNGEIIGTGDNSHGQLGEVLNSNSNYSAVLLKKTNLRSKKIKSVHCGYYHTILIDVNKKAFSMGQGFGNSCTMVRGLENVNIVSACAGYDFSFFISENGEVYGCGEIDQMVNGASSHSSRRSITKIMGFGDPIVSGACGYYHALFVSASGGVYSCGRDQYNCLCRSKEVEEEGKVIKDGVLLKHSYFKDIVQAECGGYHSMLLDKFGRALVFGHSGFQQSVNDNLQPFIIPTVCSDKLMETFPKSMIIDVNGKKQLGVSCIACGGWGSIVLCSPYTNDVFSTKNQMEMFEKLSFFLSDNQHHLFDLNIIVRE